MLQKATDRIAEGDADSERQGEYGVHDPGPVTERRLGPLGAQLTEPAPNMLSGVRAAPQTAPLGVASERPAPRISEGSPNLAHVCSHGGRSREGDSAPVLSRLLPFRNSHAIISSFLVRKRRRRGSITRPRTRSRPQERMGLKSRPAGSKPLPRTLCPIQAASFPPKEQRTAHRTQ